MLAGELNHNPVRTPDQILDSAEILLMTLLWISPLSFSCMFIEIKKFISIGD